MRKFAIGALTVAIALGFAASSGSARVISDDASASTTVIDAKSKMSSKRSGGHKKGGRGYCPMR